MNPLRIAYKSKHFKKQTPLQDAVDLIRAELEETWRKNAEKKYKVDLSHLKKKSSTDKHA